MRRSAKVTLMFLSSFAAAVMNGCDKDDGGDWVEAKRCVDNNNVVVDDRFCEISRLPGRFLLALLWRPTVIILGDRAYGGGRVAQSGVNYVSPSRVPRGGFGSTGKAFVSHGS